MQLVYLKVLSRDHQAISFINTEHLKSQKTWRCHLPCRVMGLVSRLSFTIKSVIP